MYWNRYLEMVRARNDLILNWPADEAEGVRAWVSALASRSRAERVLWFPYQDEDVPPVASVPLRMMLEVGVDVSLSGRRDLMLATSDVRDGLCLEINATGEDDEFELVAWGEFAQTSDD